MEVFFDIIEQFEITDISSWIKESTFYIFENFLIFSVLLLIFYWFILENIQNIFSFTSLNIFFLLKVNLKEKFSNTYFNVVCTYFLYILTLFIFLQNITGMIPDTLTITSFILLPAHIPFTFFIASFLIAIQQTKFKIFRGFLPAGVPVLVAPFLFVIEFISYFIRLFSLAIRLFINILAGHMLLKIFATLIIIIFNFIHEAILFQIIIDFITIAFIFLEYAACLLQAIVLVSLVAIYVDHALNFFH
jgi:ATP synthase subunit 6